MGFAPSCPSLPGRYGGSEGFPGVSIPPPPPAPTQPLRRTGREGERIRATANYLFGAPKQRQCSQRSGERRRRKGDARCRPDPAPPRRFKPSPFPRCLRGCKDQQTRRGARSRPPAPAGRAPGAASPARCSPRPGRRIPSPGGSGGAASARHGPAEERGGGGGRGWGAPPALPCRFPSSSRLLGDLPAPAPPSTPPAFLLPPPGLLSRGGGSLPSAPPQTHPPHPAPGRHRQRLPPAAPQEGFPPTPGVPRRGQERGPRRPSPLLSVERREEFLPPAIFPFEVLPKAGAGGREREKGGAAPATDPQAGRVAGPAAYLPGGTKRLQKQ